ncbi:TetR/AcrR family transcriptional regulator [Micromonospora radicis]|uniref:TetR/AcrR family transcriptional regulator n=1 Tax=Micromonospora radicis TaxID=1894971 RepID=A0A418MPY9_9ACTN|nr:TetR/AcrR family transcriptional regulator [Micromonospora radicis]RIV34535.1 TetR/AcrR family transcriptional regulator [Micromonospora radicis]
MTRRDAARNWQRIVDTGRTFVSEQRPLRLNDVAHEASVGVATVYRHFPTSEALLETLAHPSLEDLIAYAERALRDDDAWLAFVGFLTAGINAQLTDGALQPVFAAAGYELPKTAELVGHLEALAADLLDRVRTAGLIRPGVEHTDVVRLMCGVVFAASVHATPAERATLTRRYLDLVLDGLHAGNGNRSRSCSG